VPGARAKLVELLSDNGGCELPCLWGITPRKTTYQEAKSILAPLTGISITGDFLPEVGSVYLMFPEDEHDAISYDDTWDPPAESPFMSVFVAFVTDKGRGIVNHTVLQAEAGEEVGDGRESYFADVIDIESFGTLMQYYMLPNLLSMAGTPQYVGVSMLGGLRPRPEYAGFGILLMWPDKGILAAYRTTLHARGAILRGCPSSSDVHVEIDILPSGEAAFYESLKWTDWAVKRNWYKPLEEVTSMSMQDFYRDFADKGTACIDTPANLWIEHE